MKSHNGFDSASQRESDRAAWMNFLTVAFTICFTTILTAFLWPLYRWLSGR